MGLFDRVIVNYPLPLPLQVIDHIPDVYEKEFQTKDLSNFLEDYILEEDGKLIEVAVKREWVDDDDSFLKGYFKVVDEKNIPTNYHGILEFYAYERIHTGEGKGIDVSIDYLAKFNDGILVDIDMLEFEVRDASEDIKRTNEFFKEIENKRNKWYYKYILGTKPIVYSRRKIVRMFGCLHNLTGKLHSFVIRHL